MISSIGIENLGVITSAHIDLGTGLTAVTGETGAGKTMFITALDLLTGARADSSAVRRDADRATVEGVFALPAGGSQAAERIEEAGGDADGEAVLTRMLPREGRARATAGGRTVPLGVLKDVGADLVSMHGQSEQLTLRGQAQQRALLDALAGEAGRSARDAYTSAFDAHRALTAEHARLEETRSERAARMHFLRTALEAIDEVRPVPGEDAELTALAARLGAAEELQQSVGRAHDLLLGSEWDDAQSATALIAQAAESLGRAGAVDETLSGAMEALDDIAVRLADTGADLSSYLAGFGDDEGQSLEQTEERRALLGSLSAYGEDLDAVLAFEEQAGAELLDLENSEASLGDMDTRLEEAAQALTQAGEALRAVRRRTAEDFCAQVGKELAALAMPHASLGRRAPPVPVPLGRGPHGHRPLGLGRRAVARHARDRGGAGPYGDLPHLRLRRGRRRRGRCGGRRDRAATRPTGDLLAGDRRDTSASGRGVGGPPPGRPQDGRGHRCGVRSPRAGGGGAHPRARPHAGGHVRFRLRPCARGGAGARRGRVEDGLPQGLMG